MKMYRFPDKKIWKVLFGVFLFAMLVMVRDTLTTGCIIGFFKTQFITLGLIIFVGILFLIVNRKSIRQILLDRRMLVILCFTLVFLVPMLIKRDWQLMYFSFLLCIYFSVFLTYFCTLEDVARYYVVFMSFLGAYSLVATYLLMPLVDMGLFTVRTFYNTVNYMFYDFGLTYVIELATSARNYGIFREPGVYQFFIIVALYLNNYCISWKKQGPMWLMNVVLAVTMVTTFSTNGVVELGLFALVLFFDKKLYRDKRALVVAAIAIAAVIALIVYASFAGGAILSTITAVFMKIVNMTPSTTARLNSIIVDFQLFCQSPLWGNDIATVLFAVRDNTTSTMILYAILGVFGGTLSVAGWVALAWDRNRKLWVNLSMVLILFMSFNTQNLTWDTFYWVFSVMALVEKGLPLLKFKKLEKKA